MLLQKKDNRNWVFWLTLFVLFCLGVYALKSVLLPFVAGIIIGSRPFTYRRNLIRFHDSLAWIAQVGMFLLLGLLVTVILPVGCVIAGFVIWFRRRKK